MKRGSIIGKALPAFVAAGLAGSPALAQRTTFNPVVGAGAGYTDNVSYIEKNSSSDTFSTLSAELPVVRESRTGSLSFTYRPTYVDYRDDDRLDHDEHRASLGWTVRPNDRTSFDLSASYSRTQEQAAVPFSEQAEDTDVLLTDRTERDSWDALARVRHSAGQRWEWAATGSWSMREHQTISGFSSVAPFQVEDRREYGGSLELSREFSRQSTLGLVYGYREFDLDMNPDETSHSLRISFRSQPGRKVSLHAEVGGFYNRRDTAGGVSGDDSRTGFDGELDVTRLFKEVRLNLSATHRPSAGGHLSGTSTDSSVAFALAGVNERRWRWDVSSRFVYRDPTNRDPAAGSTKPRQSVAVGANVEYGPQRFGVRLGGNVAKESSNDPNIGHNSASTVELGLVWYPLMRRAAPPPQAGVQS